MLKVSLPKIEIDPEETKGYCKCRPICKSRRRHWKGKLLKPSAEALLENKPVAECIRRWPMNAYPNSPCPLFEKTKGVIIQEKSKSYIIPQKVVRLCPAPIDNIVPTPYLKAAEMAKRNGALDFVQSCCPFCMCGKCCACGVRIYPMNDPERDLSRRRDMREFDTRVQKTYKQFRIMYN